MIVNIFYFKDQLVLYKVQTHLSFPWRIKITSNLLKLPCIETILMLYTQKFPVDPPLEEDMIFTLQTTLRLQQFHTLNLVTPINLHLATFTTTITPRLFWLLFLHTVRNRGLLFALDLNISRLSRTCISHVALIYLIFDFVFVI